MLKLIQYINKNTNLWLIFIFTLMFNGVFLWVCNYDKILLLHQQKYEHMLSIISFVPYFLFLYECKRYSYENRILKFREICNLVQVPCFVLVAISLTMILNPFVLSRTSSLFFFNSVDDAFMNMVLAIISYALNYVINKKSKILLMSPKPQKYTIIPM